MKILIVSEYFSPDVFAVNDLVRELTERGHQVTVLTGLPDYTTSRIPEEYRHFRGRRQELFGAKIIRCSTVARRSGPFFRSLSYLSFAVNGWFLASFRKWEDFDVVFVWQVSPVTQAIPAIRLKNRYRKPLFLYCMDIWPECVKAMGFGENSPVYRLLRRKSARIYSRCDRIAVSSEPFFDYLETVDSVAREKMSYLPQFSPDTLLHCDFSRQPGEHFHFLYLGNIGKAQNVECILRAAAKLADRQNFTIHFVGGGTDCEKCRALAKQLGLGEKAVFYGPKKPEETLPFYAQADACLLTLSGVNRIGDTLPGKLQTYMAAGKPVIAAINGAGAQVIRESGCGLCGPADDADALARNLRSFMDEPGKYSGCGENARSYFRREFTVSKHLDTLEAILNSLAGKK